MKIKTKIKMKKTNLTSWFAPGKASDADWKHLLEVTSKVSTDPLGTT